MNIVTFLFVANALKLQIISFWLFWMNELCKSAQKAYRICRIGEYFPKRCIPYFDEDLPKIGLQFELSWMSFLQDKCVAFETFLINAIRKHLVWKQFNKLFK